MTTNRLHLRERTNELFKKVLLQSVKEQLIFFGVNSFDDLDIALAKTKKLFEREIFDFRLWDIINKKDKQVIGNCGFHHWEKQHERAELGYMLNEDYRNQGLMTEALSAIIDIGFNGMQLNRIEAFISPDNLPSIKVAQKLDFTKEGRLREHYQFNGQIYDSLIFGLLKSDYFGSEK